MKFLVLVLSLVGVYARPDVSELSGGYLPGVGGGSNILSTSFGGSSYNGGLSGISGIGGSIGGGYNPSFQEQRHVFYYAAPDDEAPAHFRVNIAPSSHRNTKIIFVKTPSYGGVIPEVIAPPSQAEDKTLVYVLVKKQQHGGSVTIPSSLGVKQAKPQVFFVKYRNQHDAEQAVHGGLNGQAVGAGLSDLGNEVSFVRSLNAGHGIGGNGGGIFSGGGLGDISGGDSGSSLLGTSIGGGIPGGVFGTGGTPGIRYGTPGASGPYKR